MSIQSTSEWRQYILTKGVFGNALKFTHLEVPGDADRTPACKTGMQGLVAGDWPRALWLAAGLMAGGWPRALWPAAGLMAGRGPYGW